MSRNPCVGDCRFIMPIETCKVRRALLCGPLSKWRFFDIIMIRVSVEQGIADLRREYSVGDLEQDKRSPVPLVGSEESPGSAGQGAG